MEQQNVELLPREKLLHLGAESLTDAELMAIFLRTGVAGKNVIELAEQLLGHFGSVRNVVNASCKELTQIKGVGESKYVQLTAVLELSKRFYRQQLQRSNVMSSPQVVKSYLQHLLVQEKYEQFVMIHLDNKHRVITDEILFSGTIDSAAVYPRVVVDSVIKNSTAAVIFAHNHPSGNPEPSEADISLTKRLQGILELIEVRTLDHFVIGYSDVVSFAERGLI